jgi:hypothetical protein
MLNDYEKEEVKTLLNAEEESSGDIWETFVNAELEVILSYAINKFGKDKVKEKVNLMT